MSSNSFFSVRSRLIEILKERTDEARRFKSLEEATRISGATWRTFWNRNSAPSGEMIESVGRLWPQYAFWLATGGTDPVAGHVAPALASKSIWEDINQEIPEATEYLQYQMSLIMQERPTFIDNIDAHELKKTGFGFLELADPELQQEIAKHMPAGAKKSSEKLQSKNADLAELLQHGPSKATEEYKRARDVVLNERKMKKTERLAALRKRKSEV
jgi:hypothetical protein